jgi:hypothetical protein
MQPLRLRSFVASICFAATILFSACNNINDKPAIKLLEEGINISDSSIKTSTAQILSAFEQRLNEPTSKIKASIWHPHAKEAQDLADYFSEAVNQFQKSKQITEANIKFLQAQIHQIKTKILATDTSSRLYLQSLFFNDGLSKLDEKEFIVTYFKNKSQAAIHALIAKLRNDVDIVTNKFVAFCYQHTAYHDLEVFYQAIVALDSKIYKPGEEMEVVAAVGSFYLPDSLQVNIDGAMFKTFKKEMFTTKIMASSKTGNHSLPIDISYINQDGKKVDYHFDLKYKTIKCDTE